LGAEIEHRLPLDWPNQHGTVAALAQQLGSHVMEVKKVAQGVQGVGWWLDMVDTALRSSNCSVDSFFLMMYGAWCSILEFSEFCEVTGL